MKKLKLKALEIGAGELLTREQLRAITGGDDGGSGCKTCYSSGNQQSAACTAKTEYGVTVCTCPFTQSLC